MTAMNVAILADYEMLEKLHYKRFDKLSNTNDLLKNKLLIS